MSYWDDKRSMIITTETHKQLMNLKVELGFKNVNQVIQLLLEGYDGTQTED